jgi:hypothetical protein
MIIARHKIYVDGSGSSSPAYAKTSTGMLRNMLDHDHNNLKNAIG